MQDLFLVCLWSFLYPMVQYEGNGEENIRLTFKDIWVRHQKRESSKKERRRTTGTWKLPSFSYCKMSFFLTKTNALTLDSSSLWPWHDFLSPQKKVEKRRMKRPGNPLCNCYCTRSYCPLWDLPYILWRISNHWLTESSRFFDFWVPCKKWMELKFHPITLSCLSIS